MVKKASTRGSTTNRKRTRKMSDLPARSVKGKQAAAVKGGISRLMEQEGIYYHQ